MGSLSVVEVLEAARARVAKGWTQKVFARDSDGNEAKADGPNACRWCAEGAISFGPGALNALILLECAIGGPGVVRWNDTPGRTQAEVISAFDRAIILAKAVQ